VVCITSDEGDAALDDVFCFLIEVEAVSADGCVDGSSIEEAFYHSEEGST
jgi:hypothetical protein